MWSCARQNFRPRILACFTEAEANVQLAQDRTNVLNSFGNPPFGATGVKVRSTKSWGIIRPLRGLSIDAQTLLCKVTRKGMGEARTASLDLLRMWVER